MAQGKRSIFEEVSAPPPATGIAGGGGMIDAHPRGARGAVRVWLVALFLLVAAMIAVGGMTRLTDSGLSITEWRPVTGAIPRFRPRPGRRSSKSTGRSRNISCRMPG